MSSDLCSEDLLVAENTGDRLQHTDRPPVSGVVGGEGGEDRHPAGVAVLSSAVINILLWEAVSSHVIKQL